MSDINSNWRIPNPRWQKLIPRWRTNPKWRIEITSSRENLQRWKYLNKNKNSKRMTSESRGSSCHDVTVQVVRVRAYKVTSSPKGPASWLVTDVSGCNQWGIECTWCCRMLPVVVPDDSLLSLPNVIPTDLSLMPSGSCLTIDGRCWKLLKNNMECYINLEMALS